MDFLLHCGIGKTILAFAKLAKKYDNMQSLSHFFVFSPCFLVFFGVFLH